MPEISAAILAGGKSRRLGIDKSLLKLNGEWLLERTLTTLSALSDDLLIVGGNRPEFATLPARMVPDDVPGVGPLGGIYSGLRAMRHERGLFVACDMPLLNLPFLRYMILLSADFDVVIPSIGDQTEPLHAIYSKACIAPIEALLQRNELRVIHFFRQVRVRYVTPSEIEVFDPAHLSFSNINTPEDLQKTQSGF
jgi:molybdopterin-guanine dinucleotide biosynthesis protein A